MGGVHQVYMRCIWEVYMRCTSGVQGGVHEVYMIQGGVHEVYMGCIWEVYMRCTSGVHQVYMRCIWRFARSEVLFGADTCFSASLIAFCSSSSTLPSSIAEAIMLISLSSARNPNSVYRNMRHAMVNHFLGYYSDS